MINVLLFTCLAVITLYCITIVVFLYSFINYKSGNNKTKIEKINFSIIIAARNEEKNIESCLNSVIAAVLNSNDNHEIIVIDDNSSDATLTILNQLKNLSTSITIVELSKHNLATKKEALKIAAELAKNNWLLFTDADCVVEQDWILSFQNQVNHSNSKLIVGSVSISSKNNFLNAFQGLDMFSMTGTACATIALKKPMLCNGANLAVKKEVFKNATQDISYTQKASGDDVFLLFYVVKNYGAEFISYLKSKSSLVKTKPQINWKNLWQQRKRWVSKTTAYSSSFMGFISLLVYFSNLSLLLIGVLSVLSPEKKMYFFLAFIAKSIIDFIFLFVVAQFFSKINYLIWFIPAQIVHVFYVCIVPLLSINSTYTWKERKLK